MKPYIKQKLHYGRTKKKEQIRCFYRGSKHCSPKEMLLTYLNE